MFQGLSTALTGLYASRAAMEVTGNNIANVNTDGYTRQRVDQSAINGSSVPAMYATAPKTGLGVSITDITRIRDKFLESRSLTETAINGQMTKTASTLTSIETAFNEPGDNGINAQLSAFWKSWDTASANPSGASARTGVIEQAKTLVSTIQQTSSSLTALAGSNLESLKNDVGQLNSWAQNVADLNKAIKSATIANADVNTLLDQRDNLLRKISSTAGVSVTQTDNNSVAVSINGTDLVRDDKMTYLQVDDSTSPVVLRWDTDGDPNTTTEGFKANINSGEIAGLMDSYNNVIPKYQSLLDGVANTLVTSVNAQHAAGLDLNGNVGGAFFTATGTTASTISVDATLAADPNLLALAAPGANTGKQDGENGRLIAAFSESSTGVDSQYQKLIDTMGVESQRATNQATIQQNITNSVETSRKNVSGVDLDEEMTNMVRYQSAYAASAKYMATVNDMLQSLIGMVR